MQTQEGHGIHKGREAEKGKAADGEELQSQVYDPAMYAGERAGAKGKPVTGLQASPD